jgi:hypothetical protein
MGLITGLLKTGFATATMPLAILGDTLDAVNPSKKPSKKSKVEKNFDDIVDGMVETTDGSLI